MKKCSCDNLYHEITGTADSWLEMACREAVASVGDGGGPFGAIVVQFDKATGVPLRHWIGRNRVVLDCDPTGHAEILAIRTACRELDVYQLDEISRGDSKLEQPGESSFCAIYASCEPCPMCYAAIRWAKIPVLMFAATRFDAAEYFADADIYAEMTTEYPERPIKVTRGITPLSGLAFEQWKCSSNCKY